MVSCFSASKLTTSILGLCPRAQKSAKYTNMVLKFADKLAGRPWNMPDATKSLKEWVQGTEARTALLDVSYCNIAVAISHRVAISPAVPAAVNHTDLGAVPLEPEPGRVSVHEVKKREPKTAPEASKEAMFVYGMASDLNVKHGMSWARAIATAEDVWKNSAESDIDDILMADGIETRCKHDSDGYVVVSSALDDSLGHGERDEFEVLTDAIKR